MPLWVFLAFASIPGRTAALILIGACLTFTVYCLPWSRFFPDSHWISSVFLIDDWSWLAMMLPVNLWYWLSFRWFETNAAWDGAEA